MDIMKMFEEYLPRWSEEKMQPMPTKEHPDRWTVAWIDFVKDVLTPKKEELISEYQSMKFKTKGDLDKEKAEKIEEQKVEPVKEKEEKELSEWEKVKAMLKNS